MQFGLLGRKLGHSYSPMIHSLIGSSPYCLYEQEPENVGDFLRNGDFDGLNVTMPYKKDVIPFLDEMDPLALRLGAVNTIVKRDGRLKGYNSDYFGFRSLLNRSGIDVAGKKALVLGSGGASATARAVLEDQGARVVVISRRGEHNYDNLSLHSDAALLVNTTPLGMYPNTGAAAADVSRFPHLELRDRTTPERDIWGSAGADTLEGMYFRRLKEAMEAADDEQREILTLAARISRQILDGQEVRLP